MTAAKVAELAELAALGLSATILLLIGASALSRLLARRALTRRSP